MICANAAIEYGWGAAYNPFFGFKKLPEDDTYEKLSPFSIEEQIKLLSVLPNHWIKVRHTGEYIKLLSRVFLRSVTITFIFDFFRNELPSVG